MADTNGQQHPRYTVELTGPARSQLRTVGRHAIYTGRGEEVVAAFRTILTKLQSAPRDFGEPMYSLHAMQMEVRKAAVRPLYVEYGVHDQRPWSSSDTSPRSPTPPELSENPAVTPSPTGIAFSSLPVGLFLRAVFWH